MSTAPIKTSKCAEQVGEISSSVVATLKKEIAVCLISLTEERLQNTEKAAGSSPAGAKSSERAYIE